jgi:DNA-binding response OmpR family regulator
MSTDVKVLIVEDNPMVLEMLRQALAPLAAVTTAKESADALLKAIDDPPDLIVADYSLPGMDGRQLFERLRSRSQTSRSAMILAASKHDISEKLKVIEDRVEDFLEKPFFIKDATARIKRVIDKIALEKMTRNASANGHLRGSLEQMNVVDLLQSMELSRKTCALTLTSDDQRCEMYFVEGQIQHARYGGVSGDDAVYQVLSWDSGNFEINFNGRTTEHTTTKSTQGLLMEGLRLLDEARAGRYGAEEPLDI